MKQWELYTKLVANKKKLALGRQDGMPHIAEVRTSLIAKCLCQSLPWLPQAFFDSCRNYTKRIPSTPYKSGFLLSIYSSIAKTTWLAKSLLSVSNPERGKSELSRSRQRTLKPWPVQSAKMLPKVRKAILTNGKDTKDLKEYGHKRVKHNVGEMLRGRWCNLNCGYQIHRFAIAQNL